MTSLAQRRPSSDRSRRWMNAVMLGVGMFMGACSRTNNSASLPSRPDLSSGPTALTTAIAEMEQKIRRTPDDAEARLQLGRLYLANGFPAEARQCLTSLVGPSSAGARAAYYLSHAAELAGDPPEKLRRLQETIQLDPAYVPARVHLAETRFKSGDVDGAITAFEAARQLAPDNADALLGLARARLLANDDPAAIAVLEDLIARHPFSSTGLTLLAPMIERQGDHVRAATLRERSRQRKDPPPVDPWMDEIMRECYDVRLLAMRFEDFVKAGMSDEAMGCLRQLEAIDPTNWIVSHMRAKAAVQQGRPEEAVREYERALAAGGDATQIHPALVAGLVMLAEQHLQQNAVADARAQLERALKLDAKHVAANRLLARVEWEAGQHESAATHLEVVRASSPADVPARAMLGQFYLDRQDPARAEAALTEAVALEPDNVALGDMLALARLRLGNAEAQAGRMNEALRHYDAAIAVRPALAEAYANKVQVCLQLQNFAAAEDAMQRLVALRPENAAVYASLGDIQNSAGKAAAARANWQKAIDLLGDKDDPLRSALVVRLQTPAAQ